MKIAITGGTGRVGQGLAERAHASGHDVVVIDRAFPEQQQGLDGVDFRVANCTDFKALRAAMDGCNALVHLAAIPSPLDHAAHVVHNNNVVASYNALSAATEIGIRRICQASSVNAIGLAFGRQGTFDYFPIDEGHPTYCEDPYSLSKWICEQQADAFARRHQGISIASLRFHLVVPERALAVARYVPDTDEADKHLWGYTLLSDAVQACLLSLTAPFLGSEAFYITGLDTVHPRPSMELAQEHFPSVPITGDLGGRNSFFSTEKAQRMLGFRPASP